MNSKQAFIDLETRLQVVSNTLIYLIENNPSLIRPTAKDIKELSIKAEEFAKNEYETMGN